MTKRYIFASYARPDAARVGPVVDAINAELRLRCSDISVWLDSAELVAGTSWEQLIEHMLEYSIGMLVFISPAAVRSEFVRREIDAGASRLRLFIPVILAHVSETEMPEKLRFLYPADLSAAGVDLNKVVKSIVDVVESHGRELSPPVAGKDTAALAASIASDVRDSQQTRDAGTPPDSVFVVHGHDEAALAEIEEFLTTLGVQAVILSRLGPAQSLLQKFFNFATKARFAIVIFSADDLGASCLQYDIDGVGERALQFRARQNVILELGFFYGHLGWESVFVVQPPPQKAFPNFEWPSDIEGAVFEPMDRAGLWRDSLTQRLRQAGFHVTATPA